MVLTVAVWNLKGGTTKSTSAINLGAALAKSNRVLLIDLDGQRTLSFGLGLDGDTPTALDWLTGNDEVTPLASQTKNLFVIPGDIGMFRLATDSDLFTPSLKRIRPLGFDVVMMDCPPNLGIASVQAILSSDRVLLPTLCEPAALKGLSEAIDLIREDEPKKPIDVLRARYKRTLVLTRDADDLLVEGAADLGYYLLYTTIPDNITVAESIAHQKTILEYAATSSGSLAYKSLAKEVTKLWGLKK